MSISNSLYIGVSGLEAHGDAISVVGDNIANASTIGYKSQRATFSDMLGSQLDSQRMGGGVRLAESQTMWTQGTITQTGNPLDLAINGGGLFMVKGNFGGQTGQYYTRDGQFHMDDQGYITNESGLRLQGFSIGSNGVQALSAGDLKVGGSQSPPVATAKSNMKLNLSADATVGPAWDPANPNTTSNYATSETVYDSLGAAHHVDVYFRNQGNGAWEYHAMVDGGDLAGGNAGTPTEITSGTLTFNSNGSLQAQTQNATPVNFNKAAGGQNITFNFGDDIASGGTGFAGSTQYSGSSTVNGLDVDGHAAGKLTNLAIGDDGTITGSFDNGDKIALAKVAIASFTNEDGLTRVGSGMVEQSATSGNPLIDTAGTGARGSVQSGALEQSNVDLGNELVTLIAYQRAYQANAKTVTTADEMLQTVDNLKQ
jgi:flagellar hook protein FlgE